MVIMNFRPDDTVDFVLWCRQPVCQYSESDWIPIKKWKSGRKSKWTGSVSINQVTLIRVYLALIPLLPKRNLPKNYWPSRNSSQFHGHHAARSKWNVVLLYTATALYILILCVWRQSIFYTVIRRRFYLFPFDLWKWPGHFSQPCLAAGSVLVHTAVVESCSTKQNSVTARAWEIFF